MNARRAMWYARPRAHSVIAEQPKRRLTVRLLRLQSTSCWFALRKESAKRGVGNVIVMVTVVGILIMVVFLAALDPILTLFGSMDILRPYALDYGFIIGIGLPFTMISMAINAVIRVDGSPKYAMFSMVLGAVINIVFDAILFLFAIWVLREQRLQP